MKLHANPVDGNRISAYGVGFFVVNEERLRSSIIVTPDHLVRDWSPRAWSDLDAATLVEIDSLNPEIVLLGTGARHRFPDPAVIGPLLADGIGVEVMSTDAACRTYNILVGEGRKVAAALLVIEN